MRPAPAVETATDERTPARAKKRIRAPEAHRAAILDAARAAFAERGFAKATIREIAQRAGVTHGLVMRHFASKEALFIAAVPGTRDLAHNVAGDLDGLPGRVARAYVERMETATGADPFIALVRSAPDEKSARRLLAAMREQSLDAYRTVLDAPDTEQRVDLVGAHLIGVTFSRYVLKNGPLATMTPGQLTRYLTTSLTGILFGPVDPEAAPGLAQLAVAANQPPAGEARDTRWGQRMAEAPPPSSLYRSSNGTGRKLVGAEVGDVN